jgi:hypothetical protein
MAKDKLEQINRSIEELVLNTYEKIELKATRPLKFSEFFLNASQMPETNRVIFYGDLVTSLKYLESQLASFHEARLNTVFLEAD